MKKFEIGKTYVQSISYGGDQDIDFQWSTRVVDRWEEERLGCVWDFVELETTDYTIWIDGEECITADRSRELLDRFCIPTGRQTYVIDYSLSFTKGYETSCDLNETWVDCATEII